METRTSFLASRNTATEISHDDDRRPPAPPPTGTTLPGETTPSAMASLAESLVPSLLPAGNQSFTPGRTGRCRDVAGGDP
jgi:hypothetical protein